MRSILGLMLIGMLVFAMAACGGAATPEEPVATATSEAAAAPTEPAATLPPPTDEPTAEPTMEPTAEPTAEPPTATPEPTVEPTKEPMPEISLETLVGMFTQFDDQAGGNNWLLFNEDGTFVARHGPTFDTGVPVAEGTFTLEGDILTFIIPEGCPDGERYQLRYATATQVHFEGVDSTCDYFTEDTKREPNWKRADEVM